MKCKKPILLHGQYYNCGSCLACRINYTSQWQLRLLYELDCWNGASFVTLTYDNDHLPINGSLDKKELQNFIKRVRSEFDYRQKDSLWNRSLLFNVHNKPYTPKIRYYACGEYGKEENTFRPHYHIILYGLDYFNEDDMDIVRNCWTKCDPYLFDKCLGRHCALQPVNKDCIGYVTGYVQKKLKGQKAVEVYDNRGVIRPFNLSSQGLGLVSALENKEVLDKGYTFTHNGQRLTIPRYFRNKLDIEITDKFNMPNEKRIIDEYDFLSSEFDKRYPCYANPSTPSDCELSARAFKRFCESNEWTIADRFEKDFLQRSEWSRKI